MRCKLFRWGMFLLICSVFFVIPEAHAIDTKVRVGFVPEQAPYYFLDDDGHPAGMCIDMLEYIAAFSRYELEYYPAETGTDCEFALNNGDIDIVLDITQKHSGSEWVTDPLTEEAICAVINKDAYLSSEEKIGSFQAGTLTPTMSAK